MNDDDGLPNEDAGGATGGAVLGDELVDAPKGVAGDEVEGDEVVEVEDEDDDDAPNGVAGGGVAGGGVAGGENDDGAACGAVVRGGAAGVIAGGSACTTVGPPTSYAAPETLVLKSSSKPVPGFGCATRGSVVRGCSLARRAWIGSREVSAGTSRRCAAGPGEIAFSSELASFGAGSGSVLCGAFVCGAACGTVGAANGAFAPGAANEALVLGAANGALACGAANGALACGAANGALACGAAGGPGGATNGAFACGAANGALACGAAGGPGGAANGALALGAPCGACGGALASGGGCDVRIGRGPDAGIGGGLLAGFARFGSWIPVGGALRRRGGSGGSRRPQVAHTPLSSAFSALQNGQNLTWPRVRFYRRRP